MANDTITKRTHAEALADAEKFKAMLLPFTEQWTIAGSVRRGSALVSDVDHVVVPRLEVIGSGGLFGGDPDTRNTLWDELDRLVALTSEANEEDDRWPSITKAIRETEAGPRTCWGLKQRAVHFRSHTHEIFTTTPDAWGIAVLIRTGPADFSKHIVTELTRHGYRAKDGIVERRVPGSGDYAGVGGPEVWQPVAVPTERHVFDLLGLTYREPGQRR